MQSEGGDLRWCCHPPALLVLFLWDLSPGCDPEPASALVQGVGGAGSLPKYSPGRCTRFLASSRDVKQLPRFSPAAGTVTADYQGLRYERHSVKGAGSHRSSPGAIANCSPPAPGCSWDGGFASRSSMPAKRWWQPCVCPEKGSLLLLGVGPKHPAKRERCKNYIKGNKLGTL